MLPLLSLLVSALLLPPPSLAYTVTFTTGNAMKIREVDEIVSSTFQDSSPFFDLKHLPVDLPELQADAAAAIPKHKVVLASQLAGGPCVCEDTSLCIHSLGGMPGPFIKFFQKSMGNKGLYDVLSAYPDKTATAVCTLAFSPAVHGDPVIFQGVVEGTLVDPGEEGQGGKGGGFGWDTIFVPKGHDRPFSEMTLEEKCAISHRGEAVRQWSRWMLLNKEVLMKRDAEGVEELRGHAGFDFMNDGREEWSGPKGFQVK